MSAVPSVPSLRSIPAPPTLRRLLTLAWPIVVSRSSQVVMGIADAVMVAPLGAAALAATTAGALNVFIFLILPMGVVFIVSTFSSQYFGEGDLEGARRHGFYGIIVSAAAMVVSLLAIGVAEPLLRVFPYAPDVHEQMAGYVAIRLLSGGAAIGLESLSAYYGGLGNTRLPMRANLVAMVLDVFGNWVLIRGNLGAPALGVAGAAWTSTISTIVVFLLLFARFLRDGRVLGRIVPRLRMGELARMLRYGLPSGFNWFFEFLAFNFFVNVVVAGLGTTSVAGMMAVLQINSVSFMPAFGIASAGSILVGQAIGAGAKDQVPRIVRLTFATAGTWQGLVGIAYVLVPDLLLAPFSSPGIDGETLRMVGARMLVLSAAWQLFDAAAVTLGEALRAAGDTAFTLWARTALAWAFFAPVAYLSVTYLGWGDIGAVFWLVAYIAILSAVLYARFRSGAWRRFELTEAIP